MHRPTLPGSRAIRGRTIAGITTLALALIGVLAATDSRAVGHATAAATPKCSTSKLVVWLNTQGDGAAGSVFYHLQFTNLSRHACTLKGFPGVSAVGLAGHQLGRSASRDHTGKTHLVTLARGATGSAVLRIVQAGNFPHAACRPVTAAGLRVFPPNQATAKVVPFPFRACSRSGPTYLSIRSVRK